MFRSYLVSDRHRIYFLSLLRKRSYISSFQCKKKKKPILPHLQICNSNTWLMQISLFSCLSSACPPSHLLYTELQESSFPRYCDLLKWPLINTLSIPLRIAQTDPSSEITNSNILRSATSYSFDSHSIITRAIIQLNRHQLFYLVSLLSLYQHLHFFPSFLFR